MINKYFNSTQNSYVSEETILETDSYKKILTANSYKAGKFYVFYTPLDEKSGTLVTHRLIVPLLYNATAFSQNFVSEYYTLIGKDDGFTTKIPGYKEGVKVFLKADDSDFELIPRISGPDGFMNFKIFSQNLIEKAGFYTLMIQDKPSNAFAAYNYDRKESDLDFFTADERFLVVADNRNRKRRLFRFFGSERRRQTALENFRDFGSGVCRRRNLCGKIFINLN